MLGAVLCLASPAARAQEAPPAPAAGETPAGAAPGASGARKLEVPGKFRILAGDTEEDAKNNTTRLYNDVSIDAGDAHIQANEVLYHRGTGLVEAHGDVVLALPGALLTGTDLAYDLEQQVGEMAGVLAYIEQDNAILRADKVRRVARDRLEVERGVFTTCSQPVPYWSFELTSGTFHLGHYAYLHGVSFWARKAPLFWSPYLVWPIKSGRATGLLFPDFRSSDKLGTSIGVPFYWPFADNADLTTTVTGYTKVGVGIEGDLNWLPTWHSAAHGKFNWINDQVRRKNRYRFNWDHSQTFGEDWQLRAKIEQVSDFDYFTDYETDLLLAATPQTTSIVDLTKSFSWYSLSFRARSYEQFFVTSLGNASLLNGRIVNNTLPQVEFRGRSQRLGRTPLFLSFQSSVAAFGLDIRRPPADSFGVSQESGLLQTTRDRWGRADLAPQLQLPLVQNAWGELTLNLGWRGTYYTGRRDTATAPSYLGDPNPLVSRSLFRSLWNAGFTFTGPRFQRIFETKNWGYSPKLKHVIEPFLTYNWRPKSGVLTGEVPQFDEIDGVPAQLSDFSYGIRQRFLALRRPETGRAAGFMTASQTSFAGLEKQNKELQQQEAQQAKVPGAPEPEAGPESQAQPVEFASIELSQDFSLVNTVNTTYDVTADGTVVTLLRHYSPVRLRARFNPSTDKSVDFGAVYDPASGKRTEISLSSNIRFPSSLYLNTSWYLRDPVTYPGTGSAKSSYLRASWGWISPGRRFSIETGWDWNAQEHKLEHQHYEARWATQCCSFRLGYDQRSFIGNYRREFSLFVDLFGIGEVIKLRGSR